MIDISEIKTRLNNQAESVVKHLLPNAKTEGRELVVGSIFGEEGKSLKVCVSGSKVGVWSDFSDDLTGDLIDLWRETRQLTMADTMSEIKGYLGISETNFHKQSKIRKWAKPKAQEGTRSVSQDSQVMEYLIKERKLTKETLTAYKISECDHLGPWKGWKSDKPWIGPWIVFPYLSGDELIGIKHLHLKRKDGKKQTLPTPDCRPSLFGWQAIDDVTREISIVEGELDAPSLFQYGRPTLSVPFGGGAGDKQQWVEYEWAALERFETIYLCMDTDSAGEEATKELIKRLGAHRCKIVKLPRKDANKCLQDGITKEQIDVCFRNAKMLDPEELRPAMDFKDETEREFFPDPNVKTGVDFPWGKAKGKIYIRYSELSIWTGFSGHGKTEMLNDCMVHAAHQDERICIASLEIRPKKTLARMVRKIFDGGNPNREQISECFNWMDERFWIFDLVGTAKTEKIFEVFRYAYHRYGIKQFVIDSLMKCGINEDDYNAQKAFVDKLSDFTHELDCHVHLVSHSRKGADEYAMVGKMDVKGTGAITDLADNVFSVWRNRKKEDNVASGNTAPDILMKPDAMLICEKQRETGWEGKIGLFFSKSSLRYHDSPEKDGINYLEEGKDEWT